MQLTLTNSIKYFAEIDPEDLIKILTHSKCWSIRFKVWFDGYDLNKRIIGITAKSKITGKTIQLSHAVLNYQGKLQIDHIDRNPLNNKKDNLRVVTKSQNLTNRTKIVGCKSKYKCVSFQSPDRPKPWKVEVKFNGKKHWGGYFATQEEAAIKANELMLKYQGEFANLNVITN